MSLLRAGLNRVAIAHRNTGRGIQRPRRRRFDPRTMVLWDFCHAASFFESRHSGARIFCCHGAQSQQMGVACKRGGFNASIHMGGALPSDVRGDCGFGVGKFDPLDHGGIWRGYSEVDALAGVA